MQDVLTMLNDLGWKASEIDCLNYGGCCVYAALVGRELEKLNIPVRGVSASWRHDGSKASVETARSNVKNKDDLEEWNSNGIYCGHVGLEFDLDGKTWHYDSSGVKQAGDTLDNLPIAAGRFTIDELELLASKPKNWNHEFDRGDIPRLRGLVEKAFEH